MTDLREFLLVAEVGQAHDGSLGSAHAYIDAASRAGADAIKFQTHIAAAESHQSEPWRVRFSRQDASRYDYWRRMEFTPSQWAGLYDHAHERSLCFISSPFSQEAVEMLLETGVDAWKVASGEVSNIPLLERLADLEMPVILSSGMSDFAELDRAVALFCRRGIDLTVLQCTSKYPCPPEDLGLNIMQSLKTRYGCRVGLSDHSGSVYASLAAVSLGAEVVEVHVSFSRESFGPDVSSSVTIDELRQVSEGSAFIRRCLGSPVDKDLVAAELRALKTVFSRSCRTRLTLPQGHVLTERDLTWVKPGGGIEPSQRHQVIGKTLVRPLPAGALLSWEDLAHRK